MADKSESETYHWSRKSGGGWRIGFGVSNFLVAEGSGFSVRVGEKLLDLLIAEENDPEAKDWWNADG